MFPNACLLISVGFSSLFASTFQYLTGQTHATEQLRGVWGVGGWGSSSVASCQRECPSITAQCSAGGSPDGRPASPATHLPGPVTSGMESVQQVLDGLCNAAGEDGARSEVARCRPLHCRAHIGYSGGAPRVRPYGVTGLRAGPGAGVPLLSTGGLRHGWNAG